MRSCFQAIKTVLGAPSAILYSFLGIAFVICVVVFVPAFDTLILVSTSTAFGFFEKMSYIISLFGSVFTRYTLYDQLVIVVLAVLTGMNFAFLSLQRSNALNLKKSYRSGILGFFTSLLGIGCVSCGSVFISSFFGIGTALIFSSALPLHGAEFGIVGIVLLLYSNCSISQSFVYSKSCAVFRQQTRKK